MTEVEFHYNAPDKLGYTCRLLRKACAAGARVVVTGEPDVLGRLDVALWTFAPLEFVPHCTASAPEAVREATPVHLLEQPAAAPHHDVLVNLGTEVPASFERFARLIEVVTAEPADRDPGRRRWKHYEDRGYAIKRHDLSRQAGA